MRMKQAKNDKVVPRISKTIAFPVPMHESIQELADRDHRSYSAEVVAILEVAVKAERQKCPPTA